MSYFVPSKTPKSCSASFGSCHIYSLTGEWSRRRRAAAEDWQVVYLHVLNSSSAQFRQLPRCSSGQCSLMSDPLCCWNHQRIKWSETKADIHVSPYKTHQIWKQVFFPFRHFWHLLITPPCIDLEGSLHPKIKSAHFLLLVVLFVVVDRFAEDLRRTFFVDLVVGTFTLELFFVYHSIDRRLARQTCFNIFHIGTIFLYTALNALCKYID